MSKLAEGQTFINGKPLQVSSELNFKIKPRPIPLFIWLCLKLCRTYIGKDEEYGNDYGVTAYMKKCFGKIYVMKLEYYKNGKLIKTEKLTRKGY